MARYYGSAQGERGEAHRLGHKRMTTIVPIVDVRVNDQGSVVLLQPITEAASDWIDENIESEGWQWFGGALAVEHRYADAIIEGMQSDGLGVR